MDRQTFLRSATAELSSTIFPEAAENQVGNSQTHLAKRKLIRTTTGLSQYTGAWTVDTAAHLLRRTMFGPRRAEVLAIASVSLDAAVETLLSETPDPPPPQGPDGTTWVNLPYDQTFSNNEPMYRGYLKAWWLGLMVGQGISIREKMVLFWHNHFPSESVDVQDARAMYRQNALFRRFALGNFKQLVREVSVDPAMLIYLNGYLNTRTAPDENYARELLELFTIGKGPQRADGDYTNYTEQDVKAAAKVLTGYRLNGSPRDRRNGAYLNESLGYRFEPTLHDTSDKQFSAAFQNTRIQGRTGSAGEQELDDLLNMIFAQPETARFICRKLYRWFVYYDIDANVEQNVIEPMATILRNNNYEIKPVLRALLKSEHFYDMNNVGCYIRTPMDVVAGMVRQLNPQGVPDLTQATNYGLARQLVDRAAQMQMNLFDPPDVAGWKAFYQVPDYYELWINTTTLPLRGSYTDQLFTGFRNNTTTFRVDPLAYAQTMSAPDDPFKLIDDIARELSPIGLTEKQKEALLYDPTVMGLVKGGEYEWGQRWRNEAPFTNANENRQILTTRLTNLLKTLLRMAEAQLV